MATPKASPVKSNRGTLDREELDDLPAVGMGQYRKAIVAAVAAALIVATTFGLDVGALERTLIDVFAVAGVIGTYLAPNEPGGVVFDPQDREQIGV